MEALDLLVWAHAQLDPALAARYPRRLARIAAQLGTHAQA